MFIGLSCVMHTVLVLLPLWHVNEIVGGVGQRIAVIFIIVIVVESPQGRGADLEVVLVRQVEQRDEAHLRTWLVSNTVIPLGVRFCVRWCRACTERSSRVRLSLMREGSLWRRLLNETPSFSCGCA